VRRLARTLLLASFATAATGCWILAGVQDRPLADAADGGGDVVVTESGGGGDAPNDAPPDSGVPDAPPDARRDGSTPTACATKYADADTAFCDDFDDGAFHPSWTLASPALIAIVGAPTVSMPHAMRAQTNLAQNASIQVTLNDPVLPTSRTLEASIRVGSSSTPAVNPSPIALKLEAAGTLVQIQLRTPTTQTVACVRAGGIVPGGEIPFADDVWHRVKLTISAATGVVSCDVDGVVRSETLTISDGASLTVVLRAGLDTFGTQGPLTAYFDDVLYRRQ
jgi:hypothetical protein